MYFIDLSLRNPALGYRDSLALIAEVVGAPGLTDKLAEADAILPSDYYCEHFSWILEDAENVAVDSGYGAFAYEGFYYVMTRDEFDIWWTSPEAG